MPPRLAVIYNLAYINQALQRRQKFHFEKDFLPLFLDFFNIFVEIAKDDIFTQIHTKLWKTLWKLCKTLCYKPKFDVLPLWKTPIFLVKCFF